MFSIFFYGVVEPISGVLIASRYANGVPKGILYGVVEPISGVLIASRLREWRAQGDCEVPSVDFTRNMECFGPAKAVQICSLQICRTPLRGSHSLGDRFTSHLLVNGVPKGIRTPVTAVKGRCPGPLDDGDTDPLHLKHALACSISNGKSR